MNFQKIWIIPGGAYDLAFYPAYAIQRPAYEDSLPSPNKKCVAEEQ